MTTTLYNKKLVETLCRSVFQSHDFSKLDEIMREDFIQHNEDTPQGRSGFKRFFEQMFIAMPDFNYTVKKIMAEGDTVMMYSTTTATHLGEWMGIPPTGNKIEFDVVDIIRIEDGKIAEHWDVADTLKLFTQVGKIKP
ncbi:MAG: ester cyclase [Dehalococcoidales bacterium]|nr:ester cyclase [Dehalococcoidales bacterium]